MNPLFETNCKPQHYYSYLRSDMAFYIKEGDNIILDIGCGNGITGAFLKKMNKAAKLIGIEINPDAAKAAELIFDKVICGDIEKLPIPLDYGLYDYIILGDILEHLVDPWSILSKCKTALKQTGFIIASVPNIRNWRILRDILFKGEFRYQQQGILDITHLRFFTKKSIIDLFEDNGLHIISLYYPSGWKSNIINAITLYLFKDFLVVQYIIKAKII